MEAIKLGAIVAVALLIGAAVGVGIGSVAWPNDSEREIDTDPTPNVNSGALAPFADTADFQAYVQQGQQASSGIAQTGVLEMMGPRPVAVTDDVAFDAEASTQQSAGSSDGATRTSSTNVQVAGIDEPDLLKVTGTHAYYADRRTYRFQPVVEDGAADSEQPKQPLGRTHVIDTGDPAAPQQIAQINRSGTLLQSGDTLVLFESNRLVAYDVSAPRNPTQTWERRINGTVQTARLMDGTIYLVTQTPVSAETTCPIEPLSGADGVVECTDIYHPRQQVSVDVTYTAYTLDPASGGVEDSVSVVGTRGRSAIYMSENGLYITYTQRTAYSDVLMDALLSSAVETPAWVDDRLREVRSYNLSAGATDLEIRATVQQWFERLPADQRSAARERYQQSIQEYVQEHRRELVTTGIVRVGIDDGLSVDATGAVPGEPLNQFSLDEHEGTLRIATTIPRQYGTQSANDLYTLDAASLDRQGSVTDMGIDERVYAVRYVGDTAYVVTFRQIDPFHVIDLSDPTNPREVGELELPGYSSYLHPIDANHVLGIGEEDGQVKAVLFDVTDPSDPIIDDTYYPKSGWSAISQSHHAFLLDSKHGVFFLPGHDSGYVVDYTDGQLTLQTEIETLGNPERAAYLDDYLYVFSDRELVVFDETDWTETARLTLGS